MPHSREASRDRDLVLKHQPSLTESLSSRSSVSVPMWDSSDPERAPPPLPLNPGAGSPITKPNTSANVAAAAEAIAARVRDSQYIANTSPTKSPEKSLIKGHHHKRLQSMNGTVKDLSFHLETGRPSDRSPERSPERSQSRSSMELFDKTPTRLDSRPGTPTPVSRDLRSDIPPLRPSSRPPLKAILGEEPPQSSTMKALQGKLSTDKDTTPTKSRHDSMALVRTPQSIDAISSQIFGLTSIATSLQQEMAQLSRRSKDNATDLVSLKEATSLRDEDIRKTLRELVSNLNTKKNENDGARRPLPLPNSNFHLEDKSSFSPSTPKSVSLPRIPSPTSFAAGLDRDLVGSPAPYNTDGAASIALLEKILREMGTKEGQEHIMQAISESVLRDSTSTTSQDMSKRLEEILRILKENSDSKAIVRVETTRAPPPSIRIPESPYDYSLHPAVALARAGRNASMGAIPINSQDKEPKSPTIAGLVNEDMTKLIKRLKDSVSESGGLTNEVKALVRELRGEVLGMGRELGRKLESLDKNGSSQGGTSTCQDQMVSIVEDGMVQLKKHMDDVLREHRRQSSASIASKNPIDTKEVYSAVQSAMRELQSDGPKTITAGVEREEILEAVREAWENYKPEIEVKNFGLERDEILECLESGLKDYRNQVSTGAGGATYEDVLEAVNKGLQDFKPPRIDTESSLTRDEIISTMRECMESLDMPSRSMNSDYQREDIIDAVKAGLLMHAAALSRDSTVSREDLLDAVKDGFINHEPLTQHMDINREDLFDAVKAGFQDLPANATIGKDTEQVLHVMKDGMENLRASIETYVDRAADVTGKDEIIETVKDSVEGLRADLVVAIGNSRGPSTTSSSELLDVMEKEFEHLRASLTSSLVRSERSTGGREDFLDAVREGFEELKGSNVTMKDSSAIEQEIRHLRETLASTMTKSGGIQREEVLETIRDGIDQMHSNTKSNRSESISSNTGELLDAFHDGLDKLRADIEHAINKDSIEVIRNDIERVVSEIKRPVETTVDHEILEMLKDSLAALQLDMTKLIRQQESGSSRGREVVVADETFEKFTTRSDIQNLEVMITQLKIKVDALDSQTAPVDHIALRPDFENLENMVKELQSSFRSMKEESKSDAATKDDIEALETLLLNSKAKLDEMAIPDTSELPKASQLAAIEVMLKDLGRGVDDLTLQQADNVATKGDYRNIESKLTGFQESFDELGKKVRQGVQHGDVENIEALCLEIQTQLKAVAPESEKLASNQAITDLQTVIEGLYKQTQEFQENMLQEAAMTAQAFDARKIEHGGLANKVEDVKAFLENIRMELKSKIESSGQGIENIALTLTTLGEALTAANAVDSLNEMRELLETRLTEFGSNHSAGLESHREMFMEKQGEHKAALLDEVTAKLDGHFGELMDKYDAATTANSQKAAAMEDKTRDGIDAMLSTKAIADELRILVDTLGHTVTESCRNMAEDSKTVFLKAEELGVKQDVGFSSLATELKADNQITRNDIARTSSTIEKIYSSMADQNPKVMEAIHDVLNVMSQHFEMAQKSTEEIKSSVREIPSSIPLPALPAPVSSPTEERSFIPDRWDDSQVHSKLDKLVSMAVGTDQSKLQYNILEQIKNQVSATAADFEAFVKSQMALTAGKEDSRQKEMEEAGIALEKRIAQKQTVEADIVRFTQQKEGLSGDVTKLKSSVEALQQEEKQMLGLKAKLQAELSSLETALQIRKEEMHVMESRAERLERRIIEGVLDQSRTAMIGSRPSSNLNVMNLKRIPSVSSQATATTKGSVNRSAATTTTSTKSDTQRRPNALSSAVGQTLKRRNAAQVPTMTNVRNDRRILSLSTISGNKGATRDNSNFVDSIKPGKSNVNTGLGALKRSHSVKSSLPSRNTSWGGSRATDTGSEMPELDKENSVLAEEDEGSDSEAQRRLSYATESLADSTTGSSRVSFAPSSVAGTTQESDEEREQGRDITPNGQLQLYTGIGRFDFAEDNKHMALFGKDSGIGSEPTTATLETDGNFFGGD